jgi:hypothetical protein
MLNVRLIVMSALLSSLSVSSWGFTTDPAGSMNGVNYWKITCGNGESSVQSGGLQDAMNFGASWCSNRGGLKTVDKAIAASKQKMSK